MNTQFILKLLLSQILFLGFFYSTHADYYVINKLTKSCGEFIVGNSENPNWLLENWRSVGPVLTNLSAERFCRGLSYSYEGTDVGIASISNARYAAEYLGYIGIIPQNNLRPNRYNLEKPLSRNNAAEIIYRIIEGEKELDRECIGIFEDVDSSNSNCKYIEYLLENNIVNNAINYRPNEPVTKSEILQYVFKARDIRLRFNTNYLEEDYIATAFYLGYIDSKFKDYTSVPDRSWIFSLIARTYNNFSSFKN